MAATLAKFPVWEPKVDVLEAVVPIGLVSVTLTDLPGIGIVTIGPVTIGESTRVPADCEFPIYPNVFPYVGLRCGIPVFSLEWTSTSGPAMQELPLRTWIWRLVRAWGSAEARAVRSLALGKVFTPLKSRKSDVAEGVTAWLRNEYWLRSIGRN